MFRAALRTASKERASETLQSPHDFRANGSTLFSIVILRSFSALLFIGFVVEPAQAQRALTGDDPLRESFEGFAGAGFVPEPAAGQLDSDTWIVTGVSAGDLMYGDSAIAGVYASGAADAGVDVSGVYGFLVGAADAALGVQPSAEDFTPGAVETRFINGTGALLDAFTLAYECWQWNDTPRATSIRVETVSGGNAQILAELGCPGVGPADGSPSWQVQELAAVVTPSAPIADGAVVTLRFVFDSQGGGMAYDQVAIDDVFIGRVGACGNGLREAQERCDDGFPCSVDTCEEPMGCVHEPILGCEADGGPGVDMGVEDLGAPSDASARDGSIFAPLDASPQDLGETDMRRPPRYDSGVVPIVRDRPDSSPATEGPSGDGCACSAKGAVGGSLWPLFAIGWLGRRRRTLRRRRD